MKRGIGKWSRPMLVEWWPMLMMCMIAKRFTSLLEAFEGFERAARFIGLQIIIIIIIRVFCPKAGPSLQAEKPRLQFCRRQVFHRKLRNKGCSFTRNLIGAVLSRCFPHPTLSSIWTDFKIPEKIPGAPTRRWGEWIWLTGPSGLHRNSPQGLNISSIRIFDQIRDPKIPIDLPPPPGLQINEHKSEYAYMTCNLKNNVIDTQAHIGEHPFEKIESFKYLGSLVTDENDHRCRLGVTSLSLIQRARVRSPVGSVFLVVFSEFFPRL